MKRIFPLALLAALAWLSSLAAGTPVLPAAETNGAAPIVSPASRLSLEAFRIIAERNIFNPNRFPGSDQRVRREPDRRTARSESFALVGTMAYEKGRFAFFDGTSSDYRRVLGTNDQIGQYTVSAVNPDHVTLVSTNQEEIKLPVGMQMRRFEEGGWELTERTDLPSPAIPASGTAGTNSAEGTSGGDDEVLKRMMQRREQEGGPAASRNDSLPAPSPVPAANTAPTNTERSAPADSGGDGESEVLRRLQRQREQELQR